jgi:hypothetical protein
METCGSTTSELFAALRRRSVRADRDRRFRLDRVEKLGAGYEDDAGAGERQQVAAVPRIAVQVMLSALHGPDCNCVRDQPRFRARLDHEQAANLAEDLHH